MKTNNFINPPKKIPIFIKLVAWFAEKKTKKEMIIIKILAWYPKSAISSGVLEAFITHKDKQIPDRLLQLIRIQVSTLIGCSFCFDLNTVDFKKNNITNDEINAIQEGRNLSSIRTFSNSEIVVLEYSKLLTKTPISINEEITKKMKNLFSEREIVIICTTVSQVNYWARLIKGLGVKEVCPIKK